ncbi:MAG: winged helix DNA-binding domain-containing protein, partial [Streptosporangiaceae bacterium]
MRRIGVRERRARLGLRHRLAGGTQAGDPVAAARSLVAVHSTDPSTVYLSLLLRMTGGDTGTIERALYADRALIRLLGMRRTVFVTTLDAAPVIQAACSRAVAANERRKVLGWLAESGVSDDVAGWLAGTEEAALRALTARGEATAAELAVDDPRLRVQITLARGTKYEGTQNVCSRVLFLLAAQGKVVRGRPRGTWTSHQYRWAPLTAWCPQGTEALDGWTTEAAEVELARRWLAAYGPATPDDLRWWAGWTKTRLRRVLTELKPAEVDLAGVPGIALAGDLEPPPEAEPWAALLPA